MQGRRTTFVSCRCFTFILKFSNEILLNIAALKKIPYTFNYQVSQMGKLYLIFFQPGEARLGTDESTFNSILATRSWSHLRQLMYEYQSQCGHSLEKAVANEFSANAEKGLLTIRKYFPLFFPAKLLRKHFFFKPNSTVRSEPVWLFCPTSTWCDKRLGY